MKRALLTTWLLAIVVPIAGLWLYSALRFYADYGGTCGLLDAGWPCTRAQYVEYSRVFVLPTLALWSCTWAIVVAALALLIRWIRKGRSARSIGI
jgi:hypothetical protein